MEDGNKFLQRYIPKHNKQFSVCARDAKDVHLETIPNEETLAHILSTQSERKLSKNLEISFENIIYQILTEGKGRRLQNSIITVCQMLNGDTHLLSSLGERLLYKTIKVRTKAVLDDKSLNAHMQVLLQQRKVIKPSESHPWRRYEITSSKGNLRHSAVLA